MKHLFIVSMMAISFSLGMNAETKKAVFNVNPQMSCQNCENKIKSNLRYEKGIKNIETSLKDQTVTVTYDDTKTTPEKIEAGFKKIGYTASKGENTVKACCKEAKSCCTAKGAEAKACVKDVKAKAAEVKACCKETPKVVK